MTCLYTFLVGVGVLHYDGLWGSMMSFTTVCDWAWFSCSCRRCCREEAWSLRLNPKAVLRRTPSPAASSCLNRRGLGLMLTVSLKALALTQKTLRRNDPQRLWLTPACRTSHHTHCASSGQDCRLHDGVKDVCRCQRQTKDFLRAALSWNCARQHLPTAIVVSVLALPCIPSWWTCCCWGGNSNLCSRSTLYILRIHSHSSVLHSFCVTVLCLIIKYIFTNTVLCLL